MANFNLNSLGITNPKQVLRNLEPATLIEHAVVKGEGKLS